MAAKATEGATYQIDLLDGKPAHCWVAVHNPDHNGEFLCASFTDARNYPANTDGWDKGWPVTEKYLLDKKSVIHIRRVLVADQAWLDHFDARLIDLCTDETLARIRCNLLWFQDQLQPAPKQMFLDESPAWQLDDCYE